MFSRIQNYLWLPETIKKHRRIFMVSAVLWGILCTALLVPRLQLSIISFTEHYILNRPLGNQLKWQQTLFFYGISGILVPLIFGLCSTVVISNMNFFSAPKNAKILCRLFMGMVIVFAVWVIMYRAEWILGDDHQFLNTTAVKKYLPLFHAGGSGSGRFWPLGLFHYNILVPFSRIFHGPEIPASAHFALNAVMFVCMALFLHFLFSDTEITQNKNSRYISALFLFLLPFFSAAAVSVFMDCIYAETILAALLPFFMLCYYRAVKTEKAGYYIAALLSAVYSTYCKEPIFGIFIIIALTNLLFGGRRTRKNLMFNGALLANGALFLFLYYFLAYRKAIGFYNAGRVEVNSVKFILAVLLRNKFIILLAGLFVYRLFSVLVKKDRDHLYYDGLLFAGMGYFASYTLLRLEASYLFFPAVILSLPSFVHWTIYLFRRENKFYAAVFLLPALLVCSLNFGEEIIAAREVIAQRRETMPYIRRLVEDHEEGKEFIWYEDDSRDVQESFHKTVRDYKRIVINAFMSYKGKSGGDYFTVTKDSGNLDGDCVFFYPRENNRYTPISEDLLKLLENCGYSLETDFWGLYKFSKQ
jgi:hypothetical protein